MVEDHIKWAVIGLTKCDGTKSYTQDVRDDSELGVRALLLSFSSTLGKQSPRTVISTT